jgi:hypothetical protein
MWMFFACIIAMPGAFPEFFAHPACGYVRTRYSVMNFTSLAWCPLMMSLRCAACFSAILSTTLAIFAVLAVSSVVHAADSRQPVIFFASDPVEPGQTVQVSGAGLDEISSVMITRLDDASPSAPNAGALPVSGAGHAPVPAAIVAQTEESLSFTLPAVLTSGVLAVTLHSKNTVDITLTLNAPDIYWMQGDQGKAASPGGWLRISGRNIARTQGAIARLTSADNRSVDLKVDTPDLWSAGFTLPSSMIDGIYSVTLSNGEGGASAWRPAGMIEIAAHPPLPAVVFDIYPQADGTGAPDGRSSRDTDRINAAMASLATRGGGTAFLHGGLYDLAGAIHIPDGVRLKGEGTDLVTLAWRSDTPPPALIEGMRNFSIEDLTINATQHFDIIRGGFARVSARPSNVSLQMPSPPNGSGPAIGSDITLRNLTIRADAFMGHLVKDDAEKRLEPLLAVVKDGAAGLRLGGRNIVVEGCDILSSVRPFLLSGATGVRMSGNTFRVGRRGWYGISGSRSVLFEDNLVIGADLQASGGGINTLEGQYVSRDILVRHNRFSQLYGWDREAVTSDGPRGYYYGGLSVPADGKTAEISPAGLGKLADGSWSGASLFVIKGRGLGLKAEITGRSGQTVTLDRTIDGLIDGSSVISIVPTQQDYLIIGNHFEDSGAAQIFGIGYRSVFAGNSAIRSQGFIATGLDYLQPQANFYTQFLGNNVQSWPLGQFSGVIVTGRQFANDGPILNYGTVIRGNHLDGGPSIRINGRPDMAPSVRNVLIEQNRISHADIGILIGSGVDDVTIRDNQIDKVRIPVLTPKS